MLLDTNHMNRTMHEAMQLMRAGDLLAATRAIQLGLNARAAGAHASSASGIPLSRTAANAGAFRTPAAATDFIEAAYRVVPEASPGVAPSPDRSPPSGRDVRDDRTDTFSDHRFTCDAGTIGYKLYVPAGIGRTPPLVVMLHGCTQSPDDFARGTRMNALAQEHGYVVAYPAQAKGRNPSRCWNWFRSGDQQRGKGEPALIAALTTHLVQAYGLDSRRVYVAGLSAGGAMAAVLADAYPDVYAAIGVHSGLPAGAAHDLPSAFAAMRQGTEINRSPTRGLHPSVPAIVFHGDRDITVDPCNGAAIVSQSTSAAASAAYGEPRTQVTHERGSVPGGRSYTRTTHTDAAGVVVAEQWVVHGGGHAWFGGHPEGSYTDPSGPDASEQMLRFFSQCARRAIN